MKHYWCEEISFAAFSDCVALREVFIPESVTEIASSAFEGLTAPFGAVF